MLDAGVFEHTKRQSSQMELKKKKKKKKEKGQK